MGLQKGVFYVAKGHLLHIKRASFAMQKGTFYNAKDALLECERSSFILQIELIFTNYALYCVSDDRFLIFCCYFIAFYAGLL